MSIELLPDEIIDIILDVLMHSWDDEGDLDDEGDPIVKATPYDDMRNVRLATRRLNGLATRYLFRRINFSLDPADWARALAISKRPLLAQSVTTIVYAATYYGVLIKDEETYAKKINSMLKVLDSDDRKVNLQPFSIESLRRGFRLYRLKARMHLSVCATNDPTRAPDFKMLARILSYLPNVRHFVVDRRVFDRPNTITWDRPRYHHSPLMRVASYDRYRWTQAHPTRPERSIVELLPMDEWEVPYGNLKIRALRMIDHVLDTLSSQCTRLDLILNEGLPSETRDRQSAILILPQCPILMSSLRILNLSLGCKLDREAEFVKDGGIANLIGQSQSLTEISIAIMYNLSRPSWGCTRRFRHSDTPSCGWVVPLERIFGEAKLPLKMLCVNGITSSIESLTTFLSRYRETLRVLRISGLASYCIAHTEQETLDDLRHDSTFGSCGPALSAIQTCNLNLQELVVDNKVYNDGFSFGDHDLPHEPSFDVLNMQDLLNIEELRQGDDDVKAKPIRVRGRDLISKFLSTYASSM